MFEKMKVHRRKVVGTILSVATLAFLRNGGKSAAGGIPEAAAAPGSPASAGKPATILANADLRNWLEVTSNGIYEWRYGDFSARIDGQNYVKSRFVGAGTGAWCRLNSYDFFRKESSPVPDRNVRFVQSAKHFHQIAGESSTIYRLVSWHGDQGSTARDTGGGTFLWRPGRKTARPEMSISDADGTGRFVRVGYDQITPEMFGARGDRRADDTKAIQDAIDLATANDMPCVLGGEYRITRSIQVTCKCLVCCGTEITKDLDDSEVIRFVGGTGAAPGAFRVQIGLLHARQSGKPPADFRNAHAFVFQSVVNCAFESLKAGNCAYAFVNDAHSPGIGRFWGNRISWMLARGCVQGFISMPFNGDGAHTENSFGMVYLNGKEETSDQILPKNDVPIFINNGEGWHFDCLNLEWVALANSNGSLIELRNDSTLIIQAFHPEGVQQTSDGTLNIFKVVNNGKVRTNINITNFHINNWNQSAGRIVMLSSNNLAVGMMKVSSFSGNQKSNRVSSMRNYDGAGAMALDFKESHGPSAPIS